MPLAHSSHMNTLLLPFGGLKESGVGKENGSEGLAEYLEVKSAVVRLPEEPAFK